MNAITCVDVPQTERLVCRAGHSIIAIGADGDVGDYVGVADELSANYAVSVDALMGKNQHVNRLVKHCMCIKKHFNDVK